MVQHGAGEYVRGAVPTNTIEGYYSFGRGMRSVCQHDGERHLHRYVAEAECRHNNRIVCEGDDTQRAGSALCGIVGKRLAYRGADRSFTGKGRVRSVS